MTSSFLIRTAKPSDRDVLLSLAKEFDLLNLPPQKKLLENKIQNSVLSFQGELPPNKAEYVFLLEDLKQKKVVGTSSLITQQGTPDKPHYYLKLFSKTLKVAESLRAPRERKHSVLRFCCCQHRGPTEVGGLLLHRPYRSHLQKLGWQISLARFLYVGLFPQSFSEKFHCEFAPYLNEQSGSSFWDHFGHLFTGLSYSEILKEDYGEVIKHFFPKEDIYLTLLPIEAQNTLGKISPKAMAAKKMLEGMNFRPCDEFHPLDGAPHYKVDKKDLKILQEGKIALLGHSPLLRNSQKAGSKALVGAVGAKGFRACLCPYEDESHKEGERSQGVIFIPQEAQDLLELQKPETELFYYPLV